LNVSQAEGSPVRKPAPSQRCRSPEDNVAQALKAVQDLAAN